MRPYLLFFFLLLSAAPSFGQVYATTDDGKRVVLKDDSTWQFLNTDTKTTEDTSSKGTYSRPASATMLKSSERNKFGIWLNDRKWKVTAQPINALAEFSFQNTGKFEEAFCMAITERVALPLSKLKDKILSNYKESMKDFKLLKEEYLTVNNHKVLHLIIGGIVEDMQVKYSGYYASDNSGVIQLVCFTTDNLFANYEKDFADLMNGLVVSH